MTSQPRDPQTGRDQLRVGHADRERVIEALKDAFARGRLSKGELDTRAGCALVARTGADLAALTTDIPPGPPDARPPGPPAPARRRRPLARSAAASGACLVIAAAAVRLAFLADPGATSAPYQFLAFPLMLIATFAAIGVPATLGLGVAVALRQRRSRREPRQVTS